MGAGIWFLLGAMFGCPVGVLLVALMQAAHDCNEYNDVAGQR